MQPNDGDDAICLEVPDTSDEKQAATTHWRLAVAVTAAIWICNYGILTARSIVDGQPGWPVLAVGRVPMMLLGCFFCYVMYIAIERLSARPFWQRAAALAVMSALAAEAFSWANAFAIAALSPDAPVQSAGAVIMSIAYWVWFFLAWAALYLALSYSFDVQAEQRRLRGIELLAHRAQVRALRYQVNPHLIFNALNSISALVLEGRQDAAEAMVSKLSAFLRAGLAMDPLEDVTLEAELRLQQLYLEIEQVRFPDLAFTIDLPDAARQVRVPSLILQPLVENAIKYAVAGSTEPARIDVSAAIESGGLAVSVSDYGSSTPGAKGFGVGHRNIAARLQQQYGDAASLATERLSPRGFRATLKLPVETSL